MNRNLILELSKAQAARADAAGKVEQPSRKQRDNHRRLDRAAKLKHIRQKMRDRLLVIDAEIRELNAD